MEWKLIDTAPFDRDLELAMINPTGRTLSLFRVAVLRTTAGSMSKPTSEFTTFAPRTGEIGCLAKTFRIFLAHHY